MNKQEILTLFQSCPAESSLAPIAKLATKKIAQSNSFRLGGGYSLQEASYFLEIYESRLKHVKKEKLDIPGLEESVELLRRKNGKLLSRYIELEHDLISFWTDESSQLVGCILGKDNRKVPPPVSP